LIQGTLLDQQSVLTAVGKVTGKVIGAFVSSEATKARENFGMKILKKGERLRVLPLPLLLLISFLFFC
jgi:hypothetical protein